MQIGPMQLVLVLVLVLILFGAGRLPQVFEQLGKGIKAFRDGQKDEPVDVDDPQHSKQLSERDPIAEAEEVKERSTTRR
jgi:sec-independent protein translocase protein TatA